MSNLKPPTTEHIPIYCHLALFQLLTSSLCSHGSVWPTWAKRNSLRPTLTHCFSHWNLWEEGTQHLHPRPGHGLGLNQFSSLVATGDVGCQGMIQSVGPAFQMYYMAGQEKLSKGEDNEERAADYSHSRCNLAKQWNRWTRREHNSRRSAHSEELQVETDLRDHVSNPFVLQKRRWRPRKRPKNKHLSGQKSQEGRKPQTPILPMSLKSERSCLGNVPWRLWKAILWDWGDS